MLPFKLKKKRPRRRVALIGLDGVSYDQIIDLGQNGYLPNITKLIKDGSLSRIIHLLLLFLLFHGPPALQV